MHVSRSNLLKGFFLCFVVGWVPPAHAGANGIRPAAINEKVASGYGADFLRPDLGISLDAYSDDRGHLIGSPESFADAGTEKTTVGSGSARE